MTPRLGVDWSRSPDILGALDGLDATAPPVLQLTVEHAFSGRGEPRWFAGLDAAAARGDLVAHGVMGAPFLDVPDAMQRDWLRHTARVLDRWPARWITEHVGCCRAAGWQAAPLPIPLSRALVEQVGAWLDRVADVLQIPVGLENLALAASADEVQLQPDFLDAVLRPRGGVLLLDLHNLWCQAVNHGLEPVDLLERHPLDLVRQIHVAGGRWSETTAGRFRRDTHDGPVPEPVLRLLDAALARCVHVEVVVVERLGGTLEDPLGLVEDLSRTLARLQTDPIPWHPAPRAPAWRPEPPQVQHAVMRAAREADRRALEAVAPGWWQDPRAWEVAVEITARWGRPIPA
jgi:hypothetical protein